MEIRTIKSSVFKWVGNSSPKWSYIVKTSIDWRVSIDLPRDGWETLPYQILCFHQVEEIYQKAHAAIRKDPTHSKKAAAAKAGKVKRWTAKKLTLAERKAKVKAAKAEFLAQIEDQKE